MKKSIFYFLLLNGLLLFGQNENIDPPEWILKLSKEADLELVYGDRYPYLNPYTSGSGSPIIWDYLYDDSKESRGFNYVLFYGRKKKNNFNEKLPYYKSLVYNYNYYLVFAVSKKYGEPYEIKDIFAEEGLVGMHLQYGKFDKDLSEFRYFNNREKKGPKGINTKSILNTPIVFSTENGFTVRIYYEGEWLIHTESYE